MSEKIVVPEAANAAPTRQDIDALRQFIKSRSVPEAYLQSVLGDASQTVSTAVAPSAVRVYRKTPQGRIIRREDEMKDHDCPYPSDPAL
mgnify:CR=1 FL=1